MTMTGLTEGIEGAENLGGMFKDLNGRHFQNRIPATKCAWSARLKNSIGLASVKLKRVGTDYEVDPQTFKITVSKNVDITVDDLVGIMLHEMLHIDLFNKGVTDGHHGLAVFQGEIKRLRKESGMNVPMKESAFKASPKAKAKRGFVLFVFDSEGRIGACQYSPNAITKSFLQTGSFFARAAGMSRKIQRLELYDTKHPRVSTLVSKRSLKSLAWEPISDAEYGEMVGTGKIVVDGDKNSTTLFGDAIGKKNIGIVKFDAKGTLI
jgi:hypothetical protein